MLAPVKSMTTNNNRASRPARVLLSMRLLAVCFRFDGCQHLCISALVLLLFRPPCPSLAPIRRYKHLLCLRLVLFP